VPRRPALILAACLSLAVPATAPAAERPHGGNLHSASSRQEARAALEEAKALFDGRGVDTGKELTPVLKDLAIRLRSLPEKQQSEARALLSRPTQGQAQGGEEEYSVKEAAESPYCTAHFCVHWVETTEDAPPLDDGAGVPDYVQTMSQTFENVFAVENVQMGWREPTADGTRGGDFNKVDVYIMQLGDQGIFGYSTPDPGQTTNSQAAYLVMDNDFSHAEYPRYESPLPPMQVTAAHEYNHVIQFGYDVLQDAWMFEATAVWMEDKVYDDVNDYVSYLSAWSKLTGLPLTRFNSSDLTDKYNVKVYGDAVWNRWLEERYGQEVIRTAWEKSLQTTPPSFAPDAYDAALLAKGTTFFDAFTRFAADTAEWNSPAGAFEEGGTWPDIERATQSTIAPNGAGVSGRLDHAAYALINVKPTADARIKLVASLPRSTRGAFALIGREGPAESGVPVVEMKRVSKGGQSSLTLENPGRFTRITAALVNADVTQGGFSQAFGDWEFTKDEQAIAAHVSTDFVSPSVRKRLPGPGGHTSTKGKVVVTFSEQMANVTASTLDLLGPGGKKVPALVTYDRAKRRAVLTPKKPLRARTKYIVKLGRTIVDNGNNQLPSKQLTWTFRTRSK
jgi:Big-like domain-containing protein